jgi:hypothetical protein
MMNGELYLHRDDVINLIDKLCKKAESLSAKQDLKSLAQSLAGGKFDLSFMKDQD